MCEQDGGGAQERGTGPVLALPGLQTPTPTRGDGEGARTCSLYLVPLGSEAGGSWTTLWERVNLGAGPEEGIEEGTRPEWSGILGSRVPGLLVLATPGGALRYYPLVQMGTQGPHRWSRLPKVLQLGMLHSTVWEWGAGGAGGGGRRPRDTGE